MLVVRLPEKLNERLSKLAKLTHRSKSYYVKQALQDFLDDQEEHLIALSRLEKKNPRITLDDMKKNLDLED
ncbi:type II toxin-antitoxin system RelB family antitoxin [Legionella clemsonensis]|uniref:Ribbon-helix-helix protein, copG family n=1 Tax=Legionella clemsonensis TaxID=1867846 RepID=A0A222P5E8_9GAMM|nr:ribbon-helix-helix domain-containing protein [Legionella clemsonensis]ASQ47076.1 Ribbon-helix-helix protein, copG family [Legionella clemsonensis]